MKMKFPGVAFDLDGTLYPNRNFYIHLIPFLLKESRYLRVFGKVRDRIRREASIGKFNHGPVSFYQIQAQYMAEELGQDPALLLQKNEEMIYRGWEPLFKKVSLFPQVKEILHFLRENGVKLGLLSDFPPLKKLEILGISGIWDAVLCSEETGRLKPDPLPFNELVKTMNLPPEKILYVGNSYSYDVVGARQTGMKTAWIRPKRKCLFPELNGDKTADLIFYSYRQLKNFMLV